MANLFAKAEKITKTTAKKNEKLTIKIDQTVTKDYLAVDDKMKRFHDLKEKMDAMKAEAAIIEAELKDLARNVFVTEYHDQKKNPGSFMMETESGKKVMIMPNDKYTSIDAGKKEYLDEKYGEGSVTEEHVKYVINDKHLEKYGEEISNAIMNSNLPEEVKLDLIKAETKFSVKKGTIEKLYVINPKNITEVMADVNPIFAMSCK